MIKDILISYIKILLILFGKIKRDLYLEGRKTDGYPHFSTPGESHGIDSYNHFFFIFRPIYTIVKF